MYFIDTYSRGHNIFEQERRRENAEGKRTAASMAVTPAIAADWIMLMLVLQTVIHGWDSPAPQAGSLQILLWNCQFQLYKTCSKDKDIWKPSRIKLRGIKWLDFHDLKSVKLTNNMCMKLISRLLRQNLLIRSKPILDNYVSDDHAVPVKCYTAGLKLGWFWRINYLHYWQIHLLLFSLYSIQTCADKSVVSCHLSIVYIMPFSKVLSLCSVPLIR